MPTNLVEAAQYVSPISHPNPGDVASATQLRTGVNQTIADRTRFLFLDALGAKITATASIATLGSDQINAVVPGDPTSNMSVVACGANGRINTSTDGANWTARTAGGGFTGQFRAGVWAAGSSVVILVGDNQIQTSPNGSSWTSRALAGGHASPVLAHAAFGGGVAIAAGQRTGGPLIQRSVDNGTTWSDIGLPGSPPSVGIRGLVWIGTRFVLASVRDASTTEIYSSTDGSVWTLTGTVPNVGAGPFYYARLAWSAPASRLVIAREGGVMYSNDLGASWSALVPLLRNTGAGAAPVNLSFSRGAYIAFDTSGGTEAWISDNGTEWFRCGATVTIVAGEVCYARGRWYVPAGIAGNVAVSGRSAEF